MEKKIAIIIERTDISLGGAERSIFELSTALTSLGHSVDILAAKGRTNTRHIHILCNDHAGKRTCFHTFANAVKKHLSKNKYDITHSVLPFDFADIYQPRGGSLAESIQRNAASYQNKFTESYKRITAFANIRRTALLRAERRLCENPDGPIVAALSQYVAEQFKYHYKLSDTRITVIPNGVKINTNLSNGRADKLRAQILAQLHLKEADDPIFFLFVANNFRLKGLSCLIKALSVAVKQKTPSPVYLIVAGGGKSLKYRHLAKKLKVDRRVLFLGKLRQIQNALSITNVAVLPTFYDPSSRFIIEALAAGMPVITTRFNGAVDLFIDGKHGQVIDKPQDTDEMADAILYYSNSENIQKTKQAILDDNLREKISIVQAAKQLDQLYDSILQKRRKI